MGASCFVLSGVCFIEYLKVVDRRCKYRANKSVFSSNCLGWKGISFFWASILFILLGIVYLIVVLVFNRHKIPSAINILKAANKTTIVLK